MSPQAILHDHLRPILIFAFLSLLTLDLTRAFVLSANIGDTTLFDTGKTWLYHSQITIQMGERSCTQGSNEDIRNMMGIKPVGFRVESHVLVESIWGREEWEYERILKITIKDPKVLVYSKDASNFIKQKSKLDETKISSFYVYWKKGKIEKLLFGKKEKMFMKNLKKGFASLLQFQLLDMDINETDSSGMCKLTYASLTPTKFSKTKTSCTSPDFESHHNPEPLLSSKVQSRMETIYELDELSKHIKTILDKESHVIYLSGKEDVGNVVKSKQKVIFIEQGTCANIKANNAGEAILAILKQEDLLEDDSLLTKKDLNIVKDKTFVNAIGESRESLQAKHLGTLLSAKSLIKLITVGRRSSAEDIGKSLSSKKNQKILHQMYDILGYVQTKDAHEAVMKKVHFDDQKLEEYSERYLWACSFASQPNVEIMNDLLNRYKKNLNIIPKVKQTLITSIASMAYRLKKLPQNSERNRMHRNIEETIINELDSAKEKDRSNLLHALYNLKSQTTIPTLIKIAQTSPIKEAVHAWKALYTLPKQFINKEILQTAYKTFLQLDKQHDSSSRTLAADILLENKPSDDVLDAVIRFLTVKDRAFEVKQYVLQRIRMLMEECSVFRERVERLIRFDPSLNNYDILGAKGLSTALSRRFVETKWSNGSLLTLQEMYGGIVKRGVVNVEMDKDGENQEIFSLGVFSGGLSGFFSSGDDLEDAQEEWRAGMQLSILGTTIRPFTLFQGQGELMGHIWSGTASDMTNAFQALVMLHDDQEHIRLSSGFIVDIDIKGATSFDLSGKVEFSLWNRNANSLIEKSAGLLVIGKMNLDANFVATSSDFTISVAPKLFHKTDIDFSNGINLCMRLMQPNTIFKHDVSKTESIIGTKHNLRRSNSKTSESAGRTYALNKKNTDMCNIINLTLNELK